jgi:hypothetical protein
MFSKKAFSMQFSWIFVLLVGFAITLLVVSAISKQKEISDENINVEVVRNINSIFTSAEESTGAFKIINTPDMGLELRADSDDLYYFINNKQVNLDDTVLFAPPKISGNQLFTWSKEHKLPMKITNVLYITNKKVKYYFVNNSNVVRQMIDFLPDNLTYENLTSDNEINNIVDTNYDYYVIVRENTSLPPEPNQLSLAKKTFLVSISSEGAGIYDRGDVEFHKLIINNQYTGWEFQGSSNFFSKETLAGAIFTGDFNIYNQTITKLLRKSLPIYKIYNYTAHKLNESSEKYVCTNNYYPDAIDSINNLLSAAENGVFESVGEASISLSLANKNLRRYGCPLIY